MVEKLRSIFAGPPCEAKGRVKSFIVGNSNETLLAMSAYIDLNPACALVSSMTRRISWFRCMAKPVVVVAVPPRLERDFRFQVGV